MVKKTIQLNPFILLILISLALLIIHPPAHSQTDEESLMEKAMNAVINSQYEKAIKYFDKILESDPDNVKALINKGSALGSLKKPLDAIDNYDKVLEIEPNNIPALNNKGTALANLQQYDEALSYFDKVLHIDPKNQVAKEKRIIILTQDYLESISVDNIIRLAVYGQITLRDSNDNLVAFIESERITLSSPEHFYGIIAKFMDSGWIDSDPHNIAVFSVSRENVTKNGQSLEWIEIQHNGVYLGPNTVASKTNLLSPFTNYKFNWVLNAYHDGYPIAYGDKFDILWNVLRPIT